MISNDYDLYLIRVSENDYIRSRLASADPTRPDRPPSLTHPPWLSFVAQGALSQPQLLQEKHLKRRRAVGSDRPVRLTDVVYFLVADYIP